MTDQKYEFVGGIPPEKFRAPYFIDAQALNSEKARRIAVYMQEASRHAYARARSAKTVRAKAVLQAQAAIPSKLARHFLFEALDRDVFEREGFWRDRVYARPGSTVDAMGATIINRSTLT